MIIDENHYLMHYGILRKSGRYPWGSGSNPAQRSKSFFDHVAKLREDGMKDAEIARGFGMSTTDFRIVNSIAKNAKKQADINMAVKLKEKKYSNVAIGERMGINESSVRSLLKAHEKETIDILKNTSDMLRRQVEEKGIIDIGKGVENHIHVSKERLATAVSILKDEGYVVTKVQVDQQGTSNKTTIKVLAKPGTTYRDIVTDPGQIKSITEISNNNGRTFYGTLPPLSVSSKRVDIVYAEQGGAKADGVMYLRPGKDELSLGGANYAQVRVLVDGTHYLKGMAIYKKDLPDGVDIQFNTNKKLSELGPDKLKALKPVERDADGKVDPDNPFGSAVKQIGERDADGNIVKLTSAMNVVNVEGKWDTWNNTISTQVLSKQSPSLAKEQLALTYERRKTELDEIMALTNPTVRRKLLETFAEGADSSAVHLEAASLPRQRTQVILPVNSLKDNEIYAPNYRDGERVALIRYPHGGTFEIPELIVNNRQREAKSLLGQAMDAVGINAKVAERLSGADFDGDTVLVIPNPIGNPKIKSQPALEGLKNFDGQALYKLPDEAPRMSAKTKGTQMGLVSNLITDMTIKGANTSELAAAVRHSMVVIDAEKHHLDYKQSAIDNGIRSLMDKYQPKEKGPSGGSSTLISRATARQDVPDRIPRPMSKGGPVDKATGRKVYEETGKSYINSKGKLIVQNLKPPSTKLAETDDAFTLSSGTPIEKVYAVHSNKLKSLANQARKEAVNTEGIKRSPSAAKVYDNEVKSLTAKLKIAQRNAPLERQAQVLSGVTVSLKRQANPTMDPARLRKISGQALEEARRRTGARKQLIKITPEEWTAIQAGAISNTRLRAILDNADPDVVRQLATPRTKLLMTSTKIAQAKQMAALGYTQAEIADHIGVSLTTLKKELNDG